MAASIERRNIFHNWDFTAPVNQRGQIETSGFASFPIDRWMIASGGVAPSTQVVRITPDGLLLTNTATSQLSLEQRIEFPRLYRHKTFTISVEAVSSTGNGGSLLTFVDGVHVVDAAVTIPAGLTEKVILKRTFTVGDINTGFSVNLRATTQSAVLVSRVKLEIGTMSTLHADPPMDYGRELAVCQRFQLRPNLSSGQLCFSRAVSMSAHAILFAMPTPVTMREPITISQNDFSVWTFNANSVQETGFTFTVFGGIGAAIGSAAVIIQAAKTNHGLTDARLNIMPTAILDANL